MLNVTKRSNRGGSIAVLIVIAGCLCGAVDPTMAQSSIPATATLTGRITLDGEAPPPRRITINKDTELCSVRSNTVQDVVVGEEGGVADVVVEVTGVRESKQTPFLWKTPKAGYVLRQKDCGFVPSLLVVPNGATITVVNDDRVTHNINTGAWNEMQSAGAPAVEKSVEGKKPIHVSCNIHSWMDAWLYPVQSPFYAKTGKDGTYEIEGIPPGKYRVKFWHASLRSVKERITLEPGQREQHDVVLESFK